MEETTEYHSIYRMALLASISCVLQISESLIPHPIPGLRLGLANVITLIALVTLGLRYAFELTILRTLLSSFIMGTFMSPAFILSFSGGVLSTLVMGLIFTFHKRCRLSIVGISVVGALSHNIVQIYVAYLVLVRHPGIFVFFPWLCIGSVFMGWITGIAAGRICLKLKERQYQESTIGMFPTDYPGLVLKTYSPGKSLIHRLRAEIKIVSIFILSLGVLIFGNLWFFLGLFLFLAVIVVISQTPFAFFFSKAKSYASLLFVSFLFPVFFNYGSHVLSQIAFFRVTVEGLNAGALCALRILFLVLASSLLVRTTSPDELSQGLAKMLSPLRPLGVSNERIGAILSLSWMAIPVFWGIARNAIHEMDLKKVRNPFNLIPILSDFIANLYWEGNFFIKQDNVLFRQEEQKP